MLGTGREEGEEMKINKYKIDNILRKENSWIGKIADRFLSFKEI